MSTLPPEQLIKQEFDRTRGRLAGFLEAVLTDPVQRNGAIQTFKALTYSSQKSLTEAVQQMRPCTCDCKCKSESSNGHHPHQDRLPLAS